MADIRIRDVLSDEAKRARLERMGFTVQVSADDGEGDWLVWMNNPHCCAECLRDKDVESFAYGDCVGNFVDCFGHKPLDFAIDDAGILYQCDTDEYYAMVEKCFTDVVGVAEASDWAGSYEIVPGNELVNGVRGSIIHFGS